MNLIWTYNGKATLNKVSDDRRITLINYYILSIINAKKLGYHTIIYADTDSVKYFIDVAHEIVELNDYHNSLQWDSFKINVLETRNDDYCLIDGDLILKNTLPDINDGIMFDTYEIGNWKKEYETTIKQFTDLGVSSVVKEWNDTFTPVINTSILRFKSNEFKDDYVKKWKELDLWISDMVKSNQIDMDSASLVGGQYLLTVMVNYHQILKFNINQQMGENGRYYTHYFGERKFTTPLVPTTHILDTKEIKKVF